MKIQRGVFYTPTPVVSFIVRSVHELLQTEFGIEEGLASTISWGEIAQRNPALKIPEGLSPSSPFVNILDPATGTATFLVEVIDVIFNTLSNKWKKQQLSVAQQRSAWNDYVPKHLLTRLYGYELMMAPYAIAHMKIGLKLYETGYQFKSNERVHIYLTNSLEPASDESAQKTFSELVPALAEEAKAVNSIKRHQLFTVVIGNPPYSVVSVNTNQWITDLCEEYKVNVRQRERQIQALSDDYVKFIRLAQWQLDHSPLGILGMITNNGFLDGHLFDDFRSSLHNSFPKINILNLHGNLRTLEKTPDGEKDDNVFDIQTGVSISIFVHPTSSNDNNILYSDLWGKRDEKYSTLSNTTIGTINGEYLALSNSTDIWIPISKDSQSEWDKMYSVLDVFGSGNRRRDAQVRYAAGFVSQQDDFAIAFTEDEIKSNVSLLLNPKTTEAELRKKFRLCTTSQWSFTRARDELHPKEIKRLITPCVYRPFDFRWTIFHRGVVSILRKELMRHLFAHKNVSLLAMRGISRQKFAHIFVVSGLVDRHALDNASESMFVFPLYIYPNAMVTDSAPSLFESEDKIVNLSPSFVANLSKSLSIDFSKSPIEIFNYAYGIYHSSSYRDRYAEFLKIDFPRLPLTSNPDFFRSLSTLGSQLVDLHLLKSSLLNKSHKEYFGNGDNIVQRGYPKF